MTGKAKVSDDTPPLLSDAQIRAIDALCAGATQIAAAAFAGVDRHTLSKWMRHDATFITAWNAARWEQQSDNAERLRRLGGAALDVVERSLGSADEAVALRAAGLILRTLGLETVAPIKPEDLDLEMVELQVRDQNLALLMGKIQRMGPALDYPPKD